MDAEHIEFFGCAIYGSAANLLNYAYPMIGIDDFFTYAKVHNTSGDFVIIPESRAMIKGGRGGVRRPCKLPIHTDSGVSVAGMTLFMQDPFSATPDEM